MKDRLFQLLGVEHNSYSIVSILLVQSLFVGLFYGSFDISAHSLFLSVFDETILAKAYIASGIAGIVLTSLHSLFKSRLKYNIFADLNLILVSLLTFFLWLLLIISPSKEIIFLVFIMMGPLNILAMMGLRGTIIRLFANREGNRYSRLTDAGVIFGVLVVSFIIPLLMTFNFKTHNLILISSLSILAATVIQLVIGNKYLPAAHEIADKVVAKRGVPVTSDGPFIRLLIIITALSVIIAFFVQYSFLAVTREHYPMVQDMARFLGFFTGSMMIFTLLARLFLFSFLIRKFGLETCLAISPILIAGFTAVVILASIALGYAPETSGFILFFILLALSRLFLKTLSESVVFQSFKVIFHTIDEKASHLLQSWLNGTLNEIAVLTAGLLLTIIGAFSFVRLLYFPVVLFIIVLLWIYLALRLYSAYSKFVVKSMQGATPDSEAGKKKIFNIYPESRFFSSKLFKSLYFNILTGNISVLKGVKNKWINDQVVNYAINNQDINLLPVLERISGDTSEDESIRHRAADVAFQLEEIKFALEKSKAQVFGLADDGKLMIARRLLFRNRLPQTPEMLRLLRDSSVEAKRLAIFAIGKYKITDMLSEVCACLNVNGIEEDAFNVLESFGESAISEINRFYLGTSGNPKSSILVLRLLANSCFNNNFIFSRLWSNSRKIKELAAQKLIYCNYKSTGEEKERITLLVAEVIGMLTWNISARICLKREMDIPLLQAINNETNSWTNFIFDLLAIAYETAPVMKIRENIETGTIESISSAIEMTGLLTDISIKPKLISLISNVSDEQKLKDLHEFFPSVIPDYFRLIDDIINRDYNYIGLFAKACALRSLTRNSGKYEKDSVIALLFSHELILREEAARLLSVSGKDSYNIASERLLAESKIYLDKILSGKKQEADYLFEKVIFLNSCLPQIPEDDLISLSEELIFTESANFNDISLFKDCIVWNMSLKETVLHPYIINGIPSNSIIEKLRSSENAGYYSLQAKAIEYFIFFHPEYASFIYSYVDSYEIKTPDLNQ